MQSNISTPNFFFFISSSSLISTIQTISPVLEVIAFYFSLFFLVLILSIIIFYLLCHRTEKCCATVIRHFVPQSNWKKSKFSLSGDYFNQEVQKGAQMELCNPVNFNRSVVY